MGRRLGRKEDEGMEFSVNHPILFLLSGIIVAAVLAQSVFFLIMAWRRGMKLGMSKNKLKKVIVSTAIFTIAPAVAIVIGVITLAKDLGIALPWMRLSVVGALTYELPAAENTLSAMGMKIGSVSNLTGSQFVTIASVMTLGIMVGIWLLPLIGKKLQNGMINLENRDKKWGEIFQASLFMGMISAFLGFVFCDFSSVFSGDTSGLIPVAVMFVSMIVMMLCGYMMKRFKWSWMGDYALPISLLAGMGCAIPITAWLG